MSVTSERRSAAFTQHSPDVEVHADGSWWPGAILGWRHDQDGSCEVSVRVAVAGVERETWVDLGDLRLTRPPLAEPTGTGEPGAGAPAGVEPTVVLDRAAARRQLVADVLTSPELPAVSAGATLRGGRSRRRHGGDVTAELPAVGRESSAGRHRAPAAVAGRHRATDQAPVGPPVAAAAARPELDCLTRPLRLTDRVTRPRLPRPDGATPR
ncbi:hypothetical protein [Geodermatophilus sp. CPCC 206100]|uniref:hypothetical protein n=1 Tax=Geodermatophilus sp. CPCC 206100 TaxID=3020054 RepID=UPI003B00902C